METNNKRRVMSIAHRVYKNLNEEIIEVVGGANDAWSKCIRYAWSIERFRQMLRAGVVEFTYIKADGTKRTAIGTLHNLFIPEDKRPGASSRRNGKSGLRLERPNYASLSYYDLEKQDWRGVHIESLQDVYSIYRLDSRPLKDLDFERLPDEDDIIHCSRCGAPMLEGTEEHNTPYGTLCDCCYGDMCG